MGERGAVVGGRVTPPAAANFSVTNVTGRKFGRVTKRGQGKTACIFLLDWQTSFVGNTSTRPNKQMVLVQMLVTTFTLVIPSKPLPAAHSL